MKKFLTLICILLSIYSAHAQWSSNSAVNNPVSTAAYNQGNPSVASDGSGGAIITWGDGRNGNNDIYAQHVNANGVEQWTTNGLAICTETSGQYFPQIVSDGLGGAIIAWMDYRSGLYDIYVQRINAAGVVQWTANGVAISTVWAAGPLMMISDGANGAIITWRDFRNQNDHDIYAQRIDASGAVQWTINGVAICTATNDQFNPTIVSDGSGGAIITWQDTRAIDNDFSADIYAQRINAAGVVQWTTDGVVVCNADYLQDFPNLTSDDSGGAIIAWQDNRSGYHDIYAQYINANGIAQWTTNGINVCENIQHSTPAITSDGSGGAIIAWSNGDTYAQRLNSLGVEQWVTNGVSISTSTCTQSEPFIIGDESGGAIIIWIDCYTDIYSQRINSAGSVQWVTDGAAISTAQNEQSAPAIVGDGSGGAIITWQDNRVAPNNYDIYAQNICADGNIGPCQPVNINEEENNNLKVYPNPTINNFTIETTLVSSGNIETVIKNTLGQTVYSLNEKASNGLFKKTIDSNLGQGLYFLTLQTNEGLMTKKIEILK